jgi:hypothetical protein
MHKTIKEILHGLVNLDMPFSRGKSISLPLGQRRLILEPLHGCWKKNFFGIELIKLQITNVDDR